MIIKPTKKNVLVELNKITSMATTKGGIALPGNRTASIHKATVVEVGPDVTTCDIGDSVLLLKAQVIDLVHEGVEYKMLEEESIVGIMKPGRHDAITGPDRLLGLGTGLDSQCQQEANDRPDKPGSIKD